MKLNGKSVLITGGAQGIGKATSETLLAKGARVAFMDSAKEQGERTRSELAHHYGEENVLFIFGDVTSEKDFRDAFIQTKEKFGIIDILFNNAGVALERKWEKMIDINVIGCMRGTVLAAEYLGMPDQADKGVVINMSSNLAFYPLNLLPTYSATKEAILGFSLAMSNELNVKRTGLKVNALCPGPVASNPGQPFAVSEDGCFHPDILTSLTKERKPMEPSFIADGVVKLLEEDKNGALLYIFDNVMEYREFPRTTTE